MAEHRHWFSRLTPKLTVLSVLVLGAVVFSNLFTCAAVPRLVPSLLRCGHATNEASAVGSLRTINTACNTYAATYTAGFPKSLANLGTNGPASASFADLIDNVLAGGTKSEFRFSYVPGPPVAGVIRTYEVQANPLDRSGADHRYFYTDQTGVIRFSTGGPATSSSPPINW